MEQREGKDRGELRGRKPGEQERAGQLQGDPRPLQDPLGSALRELWEVWTVWTLNPGDDNVGAGAVPGFPSPPNWSLISTVGGPGAAGLGQQAQGKRVQGAAGPGAAGLGQQAQG